MASKHRRSRNQTPTASRFAIVFSAIPAATVLLTFAILYFSRSIAITIGRVFLAFIRHIPGASVYGLVFAAITAVALHTYRFILAENRAGFARIARQHSEAVGSSFAHATRQLSIDIGQVADRHSRHIVNGVAATASSAGNELDRMLDRASERHAQRMERSLRAAQMAIGGREQGAVPGRPALPWTTGGAERGQLKVAKVERAAAVTGLVGAGLNAAMGLAGVTVCTVM